MADFPNIGHTLRRRGSSATVGAVYTARISLIVV